ncbi:MAG TPA: hypothetical protein VF680_17480 [Allosphingosinicella sp.]|jgi:hypothetical protein
MINTKLDNVRFYDACGDEFDGYTDGSTWNGWSNVWVDAHEWPRLVAAWHDPDDAERSAKFAARTPDADGLYSLGFEFCTSVDDEFTTYTLAHGFVNVLREWLSLDELRQVVERNAAQTDPMICHTHDFCDANMAMDKAWRDLDGPEFDAASQAHADIWNSAWDHARVLLARRYGA